MSEAAIAAYNTQASSLFEKYESYDCLSIHQPFLKLLPRTAAAVLEIGAGSLRDSRFLAETYGYHVTAVEPATELLQLGMAKNMVPGITIVNDLLPDLATLGQKTFDVVWSNNVLMHMHLPDVQRACQRIRALTKPGGLIMLGIRLGPPVLDRHMHPLHLNDIKPLFANCTELCCEVMVDQLGRDDISFLKYAVRVP